VTHLKGDRSNELIERDGDVLNADEQGQAFGAKGKWKDFRGVGVWKGIEGNAVETWT
jgi:hypothetical protein